MSSIVLLTNSITLSMKINIVTKNQTYFNDKLIKEICREFQESVVLYPFSKEGSETLAILSFHKKKKSSATRLKIRGGGGWIILNSINFYSKYTVPMYLYLYHTMNAKKGFVFEFTSKLILEIYLGHSVIFV